MALVYADTAKVAEDPAWMATRKKRVLLGALIRSCAAGPGPPGGSSTIFLERTQFDMNAG